MNKSFELAAIALLVGAAGCNKNSTTAATTSSHRDADDRQVHRNGGDRREQLP